MAWPFFDPVQLHCTGKAIHSGMSIDHLLELCQKVPLREDMEEFPYILTRRGEYYMS